MKRITLCALLMTLFLLISCNTSGKDLTDDEVAKSDGTVIDLAKITKNIKDSVAFAKSVKEIHSLVKSIDTLAKAIGKKIQNQDQSPLTNDAGNGHNTTLIAGVFQIVLTVSSKLTELEKDVAISAVLKTKVTEAKTKSTEFLAKLKGEAATLGVASGAATSDDAKKAIDITGDGSKGGNELKALNTSIDALLKDAEAAVTSAINALTTPVKP
ncbi:Vsp/OspC family lipoprotein [Borrelia puertoricensis]|uniref:Vsp/OspC family lipoprotein n=1 Tax=Borrelia puertoricensis TaxID=2756107 RepID=UPI00322140CE